MFRTLIYPSSGACDFVDELPHRSSCSQFVVCYSFCCGWYLVVFVLQVEALMLQPAKRTPPNISRSKNCNTQRTENKTTDVVIHQQSLRLLKMDILMSETCWAHNNWNKITSDIKLVFHSSNIYIKLHVGKFSWLRISNFSRKMPVSCLNVYMSVPLINVEINVIICKPCCNCHNCRDSPIFILFNFFPEMVQTNLEHCKYIYPGRWSLAKWLIHERMET